MWQVVTKGNGGPKFPETMFLPGAFPEISQGDVGSPMGLPEKAHWELAVRDFLWASSKAMKKINCTKQRNLTNAAAKKRDHRTVNTHWLKHFVGLPSNSPNSWTSCMSSRARTTGLRYCDWYAAGCRLYAGAERVSDIGWLREELSERRQHDRPLRSIKRDVPRHVYGKPAVSCGGGGGYNQ